MGVVNPVRKWRGYSKPQRSELYLRWSLYLMALAPLPISLLSNTSTAENEGYGDAARVALVIGLLLTLTTLRAYRTSLDHYLKRPSDHLRWLALNSGVAVAGCWAVLLLGPRGDTGADPLPFSAAYTSTILFSAFGPVAVGLPPRWSAPAGLAGLLAAAPPMFLVGINPVAACGALTFTAIVMTFVGCSCRSFAWLQSVVWELDAAREAQARLAVAEERLRFSRDLHDVMGRNLTTIALKSELAVQLARRGRPEAAEQMAEVQKIAQESQREVRDVVRGYRTAGLHAEAIGARAVLRSADVDCVIDLGEDADRLPLPVQSVLGWVIREATTNVLRHSEADHCAIRLSRAGDRAVLELENDGVPAVPIPSQGSGTGLRGLRERLAAHDGELTVPDAGPGRFRLLATVPL
ncbi:sensor histidine kinase [Kitasatospora sp. CM 4170]|uniref:Sensor histidine kinase n=1 Tax=Kitasatospora aburaviensis TaxID=67265 RepID=A0ABW1EX99_9ACTN|nr:sensor histidine kinase [Kitasatospora sp. CM 4170]WNM46775.1 sensor histidine kinase [Kitasatospora sp. CM 4170]